MGRISLTWKSSYDEEQKSLLRTQELLGNWEMIV